MKSLGVVSVSLWERKRRKDFKNFLKIQVKLIYNIVLVSGAQQNDPVIHIFFFGFLGKENLVQDSFHKDLWITYGVSALL